MMRPKRIAFSPKNYVRSGICAAQQTVGAASLLINGADASGGSATFAYPYAVDIYSAGNFAARTFTVTGLDQSGAALTTTLAGPNNSTVTTSVYFSKVTLVSVDGIVGTDVEVGASNALAYFYALDLYENSTSIAVDISGTINFSVEKCFERITSGVAPNWIAGGIATQTADSTTAYTASTAAVRLKVHSYSNAATAALQVNQGRSH